MSSITASSNISTKNNVVTDNIEARKHLALPKRLLLHFKEYWHLWVMVLPTLVFVFIFAYIPMYGIQLAFREFDPSKGLTGGKWVGFKYFQKFIENPTFWSYVANTFKISFGTLILGFFAPIILALLINQVHSTKVKGFIQTITYMPHFISTVVIVAMINVFLDPASGLLGRHFGDTSLLNYPNAVAPLYWISEIWQHTGWSAIIYLAALSSVDLSLYEAAKIDGAGRLQLIRYVDIPTILPTCVILLIMHMGSVLSVGFEKAYLMQNVANLQGSEVIATFTYKIGMQSFQYSYSTAIGLFNTVINFIILIIANSISHRVADTSIF